MGKPMTFDDYLEKELQNPEFKAEWDALEPEFQSIRSSIEGHFFSDSNMRALDNSIKQAGQGKVVVKSMDELERYADGD